MGDAAGAAGGGDGPAEGVRVAESRRDVLEGPARGAGDMKSKQLARRGVHVRRTVGEYLFFFFLFSRFIVGGRVVCCA